jgi:secondary thiamine-phosphate synthase enzyme
MAVVPNAQGEGVMSVRHLEIRVTTRGGGDMHDLTERVAESIASSRINEGTVTVFVPGSTAGITTIEFETGLLRDFPETFERIAPRDAVYEHDERWHDGNGHSHVRASLLGPSLTVPVRRGLPVLGTWQQIVLVDFDNRARERNVLVTVMGE